jgi:hypothetical protein
LALYGDRQTAYQRSMTDDFFGLQPASLAWRRNQVRARIRYILVESLNDA